MKWFSLLFALALPILAQEKTKEASDMAASMGAKSVIVIEPKMRATDFAQAFDFLRKDKPSQKIVVQTENGMLVNVTEVTPSSGGTLLFIKMLSNQGVRTSIIPIEKIMEITYSP